MALTAVAVAQAKPKGQRYDLADGNGLYLRVHPSGAKSWRLRYMLHGKAEVVGLGSANDLSLADARAKAAEARTLIRAGVSPAAEAQRLKHERRVMPTVEEFASEYIELHAKVEKRSWKADEQMLARWVIPQIGRMKLVDVHRRDVVDVVDAVKEAGNARQPGKVLAVLRRMLRFAVERGVIEKSPAVYVTAKQPEAKTHALKGDEIRQWWEGTFEPARGTVSARLALRLLLLTGQRGSEVGGIELSEIDLNARMWFLPSARRKMGQEHNIPLTDAAIAVIQEAQRTCAYKQWLFPNKRRTGGVRVDGGMRDALNRIFHGRESIPTTHSARRTVATEISDCLDVSLERVAAVLGHYPRSVTKDYIKRCGRKARAPLEAWARHLEAILDGTAHADSNEAVPDETADTDTNVVPFTG